MPNAFNWICIIMTGWAILTSKHYPEIVIYTTIGAHIKLHNCSEYIAVQFSRDRYIHEQRECGDITIADVKQQKCYNHSRYKLLKTWWRHPMEIFSASLALCEGNPPVTGEFPYRGHGRRALKFSLVCVWTNVWTNNRDPDDLRRHHAHYDVSVIIHCGLGHHMSSDHPVDIVSGSGLVPIRCQVTTWTNAD